MHTESEAALLWCPMARVPGRLSQPRGTGDTQTETTVWAGTQNRGHAMGGALDNCRCIASKCAMWRWAYNDDDSQNDVSQSDTIGYCGLGGRP